MSLAALSRVAHETKLSDTVQHSKMQIKDLSACPHSTSGFVDVVYCAVIMAAQVGDTFAKQSLRGVSVEYMATVFGEVTGSKDAA